MKFMTYVCSVGAAAALSSCCSDVCDNGKISQGASQWTEANRIFTGDVHWRGSDDAYSIPLGNDRILWIFGDTLISDRDTIVPRGPEHCRMPRNGVGIMEGTDPATARISFYWGNDNDVKNPGSFFHNPALNKDNWFWPGDGVVLPDGKTLVMFMMNIKPDTSMWGFGIAGWEAAKITGIDKTPDKWTIEWLKSGDYSKYEILLGSGGDIVDNGYLYAFGGNNAKIGNNIFLARWPLSVFDAQKPDLSDPEWWAGEKNGWLKQADLDRQKLKPAIVWDKGQNEFTVNKLDDGRFIMTQTAYSTPDGRPGNSDLVCRVSKSLTGPWSEQKVLYHNLCRDESMPEDLNVYAGKYHPDLTGAECIFTYATNTQSLETLWKWQNIYYPHFIKMSKNEFYNIINR